MQKNNFAVEMTILSVFFGRTKALGLVGIGG